MPDYDGVLTPSVGKGRAAGVSLGFCKAFDMVPHNVHVAELKEEGSDECIVWIRWIRHWLAGHVQRVIVKRSVSM